MITKALRRVRPALWYAKNLVKMRTGSDAETYARLCRAATKTDRHTPGEFHFPFGTMRHVDWLSFQHQYFEIFLKRCYEFACDHDTPLILDCGGNVGLSVIWFKQRYPRSRVIVFEADPSIAEVLKVNISALNLTNVEVVEAAVWKCNGAISFEPDGSDGGHIDERAQGNQIKSVRLADYIEEPIDLLKIDIEGAEYDVLSDLCETGKIRRVNHLIGEFHGRRQACQRLGEVVSKLSQNGFKLTFTYARSAPFLPGDDEPTPFSAVPDAKCLLHLYGWRS